MTYESLCKKMGYNPLKDRSPYEGAEGCIDSIKSPFSVLTDDELQFMMDYLNKHIDEIK